MNAFQQGFEILSDARTLPALANSFCSILKEQIRLTSLNLWYKPNQAAPWRKLKGETGGEKPDDVFFDTPCLQGVSSISEPGHQIRATLPVGDKACFGIDAARNPDEHAFKQEEILAFQLFLQVLSNSHQVFMSRKNEREITFSLNNRMLQLNSLVETSARLFRAQNETEVLATVLEQAAALTNAAKAVVSVTKDGREIKHFAFPKNSEVSFSPRPGRSLEVEFTFQESKYHFSLHDKESRDEGSPFDETDSVLLTGLVRQVQAVLETFYLQNQTLEKQRLEQEITVAATIQQALMPTEFPEIEGYDIYGQSRPCKEVGGDFFHNIPMPDGRIAFVVADVAGKGIPAALLVSSLHASLHAYLAGRLTLEQIARRLNSFIYEISTENKFITCFLALLEPATGRLEIMNAGHEPGLLKRANGELLEIASGGLPLGIFESDHPVECECMTLEPGDSLLLYTDGVLDATDEDGEFFSMEYLMKGFDSGHQLRARQLVSELSERVRSHLADTAPDDDVTFLVMKRLP